MAYMAHLHLQKPGFFFWDDLRVPKLGDHRRVPSGVPNHGMFGVLGGAMGGLWDVYGMFMGCLWDVHGMFGVPNSYDLPD